MRGFGAIMASQCLKALAALLYFGAGLVLLLLVVQWWRGDTSAFPEVLLMGGAFLAVAPVCQILGRKFASYA
jgi:hypothetical protein